MPVFVNNRPIKRTREYLTNKKSLVTTEMEYKQLVFIHIPRCAGQTLTAYFTGRYGTPTVTGKWQSTEMPKINSVDSALAKLTGLQSIITVSPVFDPKTPLQNQPLAVLRSYRDSLGVSFNSLTRIMVCVRNPYDRIISHMFSLGYINQYNTPDEVFTQMVAFYQKNQLVTQMSYITDEFGNVATNIRIIHVETLEKDMHSLGYTDFTCYPMNRWLGRGSWSLTAHPGGRNLTDARPTGKGWSLTAREGDRQNVDVKYAKYLNDESKELIQQIYDTDFRVFGYKK